MRVAFSTIGVGQDIDGYEVTVGVGLPHQVESNGSLLLEPISPGEHDLAISDVAMPCDPNGWPARAGDGTFTMSVAFEAGETTVVNVTMNCTAKPIAFGTDRYGSDIEISRMNADGSGVVSLAATGTQPRWSPDGSRIAFHTFSGGDGRIFVMDADGSNLTPLASTPGASDSDVTWSPDGTRLAFSRFMNDESLIYAVNADGSGLAQLTDVSSSGPDWGADGRIVFSQFNEVEGRSDIHVMDGDGGNNSFLTDNGFAPAWSPDQMTVAFNSDRDGDLAIFLVGSDGSNVRRRSGVGDEELLPRWSPDGASLIFEILAGVPEVGVGSAASSGATNISQNAGNDLAPDWSSGQS